MVITKSEIRQSAPRLAVDNEPSEKIVSPPADVPCPLEPVIERWQSPAVANSYDRQRFVSWAGRLFNYLSHRAVGRALNRIPGPVREIMDIPCGTGRFLNLLSTRSERVIGADVSQAMLDVAATVVRQPQRVRLMRADITQLGFADAAVDVVVCQRFMMHPDADGRRAALCEMGRVAGRFVVVEYGYTSPWLALRRKLKRGLHAIQGRKVDYVRAVPWPEILADLDSANLRLVSSHYTARGLCESVILLLGK